VILLGPAEENLLPLFSGDKGGEILRSPNLDRLSLLLQEASLYVGHDSGITHLAAMLGAPTIGLFKHTSVARWHPLGPKVKVIEASKQSRSLSKKVLSAREFLQTCNNNHLNSLASVLESKFKSLTQPLPGELPSLW
jgi:ADP-heptose:LPS heptosyltransferase